MFPVAVIAAPEPVVGLDDAARHLRDIEPEEHVYVDGLLRAAQGWIDGPAGWLGRSIGRQTLEMRRTGFVLPPDGVLIRLPYGPILDVEAVSYVDAGGEEVELDDGDYRLVGDMLSPVGSWPGSVAHQCDAVRIRYIAGYEPEKVPAPIKQAILLLVGQWYAVRQTVVIGSVSEVPFAVEALLQPYRVWR